MEFKEEKEKRRQRRVSGINRNIMEFKERSGWRCAFDEWELIET